MTVIDSLEELNPMFDKILTPDEAAKFLGIKEQTLAVWRSKGRHNIPFIRSGKIIRYRLTDLEAWVAAHVVGPRPTKHEAR